MLFSGFYHMGLLKHKQHGVGFGRICGMALLAWGGTLGAQNPAPDTLAQVPPAQLSITVRASIPRHEISLGENLTFTIEITWNANAGEVEFTWPAPPKSDKFEVVGNASSSQRTAEGGQVMAVKKFTYELKPLTTGPATIEPVTVRYRQPVSPTMQEETTRYLDVTVLPLRPERRWGRWLLAVLLCVVVAAGWIWRKKLPRLAPARRTATPEIAPIPVPAEKARAQAKEMERLIMSGDTKDYCAGVSRTLKTFLEEQYKVGLENLLTDQVLARLRAAQVPETVVGLAQRIMEQADIIKFATNRPDPTEVERIKIMFHNLLDQYPA
jgi:hypothetical protein